MCPGFISIVILGWEELQASQSIKSRQATFRDLKMLPLWLRINNVTNKASRKMLIDERSGTLADCPAEDQRPKMAVHPA